jgi:CRP-like cAMP-binding protein
MPESLKGHLITRRYGKGNAILHAGEDNQFVYFVEQGTAMGFIQDLDGTTACIDKYGPGDFFGELQIFCPGFKTIEITALEDCVLHILHKQHLMQWMKDDFNFTLGIISHLSRCMKRYSDNMVFIQLYNVRERVAKCIMDYGDMGILDDLSKQTISIVAKTPIRSVNRALASLIEIGAIAITDKRIKIQNKELLMKTLGS